MEIWQKQLSDSGYDIILGVRSSVFLPFRKLGLVIVDEEHENTYKQQDPAPRYHARNAATVLAALYGAKTLLGTATPSIETWHNAMSGKVRAGGAEGEVQGDTVAGDYSGRHQGVAAQEADERALFPFVAAICPRGTGTERTGHSVSEPQGVCPDDRMPYVRVGSQM